MVEPVKNCTTCRFGVQLKGNMYRCAFSLPHEWDSHDPNAVLKMNITIRTDTIAYFDFPDSFRGDGVKTCNRYAISDRAREIAKESFSITVRRCKICGRILTGPESIQAGCGPGCAARAARRAAEQNDPNQISFYGKDEIYGTE